jgi:protein-histidine pros-kinase
MTTRVLGPESFDLSRVMEELDAMHDRQPYDMYAPSKLKKLPFGCIMLDRDAIIRFSNPLIDSMFEYDEGELLGKDISVLVGNQIKEQHQEIVSALEAKGEGYFGMTVMGETKSHRYLPLNLSMRAMRLKSQFVSIAFITRDGFDPSEDRRLAKAEFEHLMSGLLVSVVMVDQEGEVVSANRAAQKLFEYSLMEITSKNINMLLDIEMNEQGGNGNVIDYITLNPRLNLSATGNTATGIQKDGKRIPVVFAVSNFIAGDRLRYIICIVDRTDENATQELRRIVVDQGNMLQSAAAKEKFWATLSHEMRTPLSALLGVTESMQDCEEFRSPQSQEWIKCIHECALHLINVFNDVLDVSKTASGQFLPNFEPSNLHEFLETNRITYHALTKRKELSFVMEVDPELPAAAQLDLGRMRQILHNLVMNALRFTEEGSVTLRVRLEEAGAGPFLRFDVIDTGVGIDHAKEADLFKEFEQLRLQKGFHLGTSGVLSVV